MKIYLKCVNCGRKYTAKIGIFTVIKCGLLIDVALKKEISYKCLVCQVEWLDISKLREKNEPNI